MRAIGNFLLFIVAFALVAVALGAMSPRRKVAIVTPKLTWLETKCDDYDVLFLGSSRTYRQIIPELFDSLMAEAGKPVKSFNLGIDGMRPPEDTFVLEEALAKRSKPLKYVFVECNPLRLAMREEDRGTLRAMYWHDFLRTLSLFRRAFLADEKKRSWKDRVGEVWKAWPDFAEHGENWLQNSANLGHGNTLLENWIFKGEQPGVPLFDLGPRQDGYRASESPELMNPSQLAEYQAALATMREKPPKSDAGDRISVAELETKRLMIEKAGAKMVLLIPPYTANRYFRPKTPENSPLLLDFSSPEKYPQLFAPEHHSDSGHVNRAGANLYTREIVRALLEHIP